MERERQVVGSTTSLTTNDLIGSKKPSSSPPPPNGSNSSTGGFDSIFGPSKVLLGRECDMAGRRRQQDFANEGWNSIPAAPGERRGGGGGENERRRAYESIDSIFKEDKSHPCHLSSSIFYGGQDNYSSETSCNSSSSMTFDQYNKKDGADPDDGSASRGNWWQGSLYY